MDQNDSTETKDTNVDIAVGLAKEIAVNTVIVAAELTVAFAVLGFAAQGVQKLRERKAKKLAKQND